MVNFAEELVKDLKKRKVKTKPIIRKFDPLSDGIPLEIFKELTPNQIKKQLRGGK
tara:strand:+ start:15820 stop:15984 length:165 start_codon:yes stop_codon:yes gene_type:complete